MNLSEIQKINKDNDNDNDNDKLNRDKKLFSDNDKNDVKYRKEIKNNLNLKENKEGNLTSSRSTGNFRVVIKRIKMHRSYTKDKSNNHITKIKPIKSAKNFIPFITDINNIPTNKFIKKTISITVNKNEQVLNKNKSNKY